MDWQAIALSLRLAVATTVILLMVGLPLAYWLSTSAFPGKWLIESMVTLPLVLPPTVLGFYFLFWMGPHSSLGHFYEHFTGDRLSFSFSGLLLGSVLYSLPFAVQPFLSSFTAIDPSLLEASWCLGVSKFQTWLRVVLPQSLPGILGGSVLCFAHTLGEFGIVMMIGGNIPNETRTLSVSIYDSVQALDFDSASRSARLLVAVSFIVLALVSLLKRKIPNAWQIH